LPSIQSIKRQLCREPRPNYYSSSAHFPEADSLAVMARLVRPAGAHELILQRRSLPTHPNPLDHGRASSLRQQRRARRFRHRRYARHSRRVHGCALFV
jgi:hypothetical protein